MRFQFSRQLVLLVSLCTMISFSSNAQNFEISTDVCDSISPTSYFIHVSGYGAFTDSMTLSVELISADSLETVFYSGSKDFSTNGTNSLTNFSYNSSSELFSMDIGTYSTRIFRVRIRSWINAVINEELILDTY